MLEAGEGQSVSEYGVRLAFYRLAQEWKVLGQVRSFTRNSVQNSQTFFENVHITSVGPR